MGERFDVAPELACYYNGRVKQVFAYITNRCQLRCRQCLYKPFLEKESQDVPFDVLMRVLEVFRGWGAYKLSFLGGEPTLYACEDSGVDFIELLEASKRVGYEYVRFDTNGQYGDSIAGRLARSRIQEVTFSIDGFDPETNDWARGAGTFERAVKNVRLAVDAGMRTQITCCVHRRLCPDARTGRLNLERMVGFARELGVRAINFHPVLAVGVARDSWLGGCEIDRGVWSDVYNGLLGLVEDGGIDVRLPLRYARAADERQDASGYCPVRMAERALVMPDGTIKVCAFNIGMPDHIGTFSDRGMGFNGDRLTNEWERSQLRPPGSPCYRQAPIETGGLSPVCMSFKPGQREIVWESLASDTGERGRGWTALP